MHVFRSVVHQLLTTVRNPSKVVSGHFRPAESNCDIHLSIALLVVARLARTSPISEGEKFRPHIFTSCANTSQLPSEFHRGLFLDLFDASNLPVPSVCPWHHWLFCYKQKYLQFLRRKHSVSFFTPLYHHFQLQSEQRERLGLDLLDAPSLPEISICP